MGAKVRKESRATPSDTKGSQGDGSARNRPASDEARTVTPKPPKPKKCKVCATTFTPARPFQTWCSPECGLKLALAKKAKADTLKAREEKRADKAKRESLKNRGKWIKEAQAAVNRFRRLEDLSLGRTCISCQRPRAEIEGTDGWKPGGAFDAGHFQGVGRKPELRFHPRNIWLQCKSCNAGSGKYARKSGTVEAAFEANLRALIGDAEVDWLKGPHAPLKLTVEALKALRDEYRAKAKAMDGLSAAREKLMRASNQKGLSELIRAFDSVDEVCGK